MEKIGDTLKNIKFPNVTREPTDDEYIDTESDFIYCKKCKTARQYLFEFGDEKKVWHKMCQCQQEKHDADEKAQKEAEHRQRIEALRKRAIPNPGHRDCRFSVDDGKTPKQTETCKNFVRKFSEFQKFGGGLLLWGNIGTGKTFYAMCIANALVDRGYEIYTTTLAAIIKMAQDFDNADVHFDRLMRKSMIVIDDLGTERGTTFAHEQIYKFIDGCTTHNIPLVFTTNYPPSVLQAARDDTTDLTYARIYSRILEKCTPVAVIEIKRRENNEKENYNKAAELLGLK